MIDYYDKAGNPIDMETFGNLHGDPDYKRVALTVTDKHAISTVWLGLDHQYGDGPPIIFETMVFSADSWNNGGGLHEEDMRRYSTEADALEGHAEMVESWSD
jgi:hypothetical protein